MLEKKAFNNKRGINSNIYQGKKQEKGENSDNNDNEDTSYTSRRKHRKDKSIINATKEPS